MRPRRYIPYSERHAPDYVPEPLPFADEPNWHAEHRDRLAWRAAACFALGCIAVAVAVMVL
jgi:hypothetical protein